MPDASEDTIHNYLAVLLRRFLLILACKLSSGHRPNIMRFAQMEFLAGTNAQAFAFRALSLCESVSFHVEDEREAFARISLSRYISWSALAIKTSSELPSAG